MRRCPSTGTTTTRSSSSSWSAALRAEAGLGAVRGDPFVHYAMIYLLAQNGEAGVACSIACTDGLVRALRATTGRGRGPVGPLEQGLKTLLRHVLTPSRFACVLFAAGAMRRAERLAGEYAEFREAFGHPIARYPLVRRAMDTLSAGRREALVVAFELLRLWEAAERAGHQGQAARDFRILLSLAKPALTRMATEQLHEAMMVLGGNGIEERFSPLPRLYRDGVIMETWEGPHNVLYTQAVRDMARFDVEPAGFLERVTGAPRPELAGELRQVLNHEAVGDAAVGMADLAPALMAALGRGRAP